MIRINIHISVAICQLPIYKFSLIRKKCNEGFVKLSNISEITYICRCMIIDDNGMVILHRDFIEDPPDDLNKVANVHIVIKVTIFAF